MIRHISSFAVYCFFSVVVVFAQKPSRIELQHADVIEFDEAINRNADRLIGHVSFKHEDAVMTCDSAYLYKNENNLEAFGSVRINQGDTVTITSRHLLYLGDLELAHMTDNVVMTNRNMILRTSRLDYNMKDNIAFYTDSAHITDADNVLTSKRGYFYSNTNDMFFKRDVILTNPKFTLTSDTLKYNTTNKIAYFLGPTNISSKENLIYCENGWYNTDNEKSLFTDHAYLKTKEQLLKGDTVKYDRIKKVGISINNVSIYDSTNKVMITGDYAEHHEVNDSSFVTGHATMIQMYDKDSLFMHGDTLKAFPEASPTPPKEGLSNANPPSGAVREGLPPSGGGGAVKRNLYVYHRVKMFKNDLQGKCDSLVYAYKDSTIRMYVAPVLWSGLNQLTADSITIQTANGQIDKMYLVNSAFITSRSDSLQTGPVDSLRFNQIRGKNMTGYFADNKLYKIVVNGNGQTIYYSKNKKQKDFGVNRSDCSDLVIRINENKVQEIKLLNAPDGTLYPIKELPVGELRLKGFNWKDQDRPKTKEDIYNR